MKNKMILDLLVKGLNAGRWQWNIKTGEESQSESFLNVLGYTKSEMAPGLDNFLTNFIAPQHQQLIREKLDRHLKYREEYDIEVLIKTKAHGFRWFRSIGVAHFEGDEPIFMVGAIIDIHKAKNEQLQKEHLMMVQNEVAEMAQIGSWEVQLEGMIPLWSDEVYRIHEVPVGIPVDIEKALDFFNDGYKSLLTEAVELAVVEGKGYDLNLEMTTAKGKKRWVRTICNPIKNKAGKVIILRGSFQDITEQVRRNKEAELKTALLTKQNDRLQNFAYITGHDLRNHAAAIEGLTNVLSDPTLSIEEQHVMTHSLKEVSSKLSETIHSLGELVAIQGESTSAKHDVRLEDVFQTTRRVLKEEIEASGVELEACFDEPVVPYVPAYMDSIFNNMLSNAIKYRHPERVPQIKISCIRISADEVQLSFADNGQGIDLEKYGDTLFKLYGTFHNREDSTGVGLFLIKNQVESQGGSIAVESVPGIGTTFTLTLQAAAPVVNSPSPEAVLSN